MEFIKSTLKQIDLQEDTLYDLMYSLIFFMSLEESEEDIKNGRVITLEESKEEMKQKYASFNIK